MRYTELKFEGKVYTEQWKIDEILLDNGFKWMINAEIGNARLEILKDTLIWNGGIWYNGNWYFGVFRDGEWKYGTWENGVWYNGKWKDGTFKSGIIFRGIFIKGEILGGEIRGGSFIDCDISPKVKEYVEGEKQQEEQEKLEPPVIEPVDAETDLHVVVKEGKYIDAKEWWNNLPVDDKINRCAIFGGPKDINNLSDKEIQLLYNIEKRTTSFEDKYPHLFKEQKNNKYKMKNLKTFEQHITEGKHGRFEIFGTKNGKEITLGYATSPKTAEGIKDDYEKTGDFDDVWFVDTYKDEEFA